MKILIVAPYPPARDGIGAYAVQQATALRAHGHHVEVLSPVPSAAHHHLELRGWRGPLALAKRVPRYDRVVVHFHLDLFYPVGASRREKVAITAGLSLAFAAARNVDLIIHEIDYNWGRRRSLRLLTARMLRSARRMLVHTETERRSLCAAFGLPTSSVTLIRHGSDFLRQTDLDRPAARRRLGVPADPFVFLAIGFVQPHKGFDRAIEAFDDLGSHNCLLYIVGSVRVEDPGYLTHVKELRALASGRPGVEVRIEYVSDERFDEWLVAADVILLPYRHIWSSGVLERARLYERTVIASSVGGLRDQGYGRLVSVADDAELARAVRQAAGRQPASESLSGAREAFEVPVGADRDTVALMVRERAGRHRRPGLSKEPVGAPPAEVLPLLRLARLDPPSLAAGSRSRRAAKRLVNRLLRWQTEPLRAQVNALRDATVEVAESLAAPDVVPSPDGSGTHPT